MITEIIAVYVYKILYFTNTQNFYFIFYLLDSLIETNVKFVRLGELCGEDEKFNYSYT